MANPKGINQYTRTPGNAARNMKIGMRSEARHTKRSTPVSSQTASQLRKTQKNWMAGQRANIRFGLRQPAKTLFHPR